MSEREHEVRVPGNQVSRRDQMPGMFRTSIQSLKKRTQQIGSLNQEGSSSQGIGGIGSIEGAGGHSQGTGGIGSIGGAGGHSQGTGGYNQPAPPQIYPPLHHLKASSNDSLVPGPLERSAMIMNMGSEKRSEKAGKGYGNSSSDEQAAPSVKIESLPSSGEKQ